MKKYHILFLLFLNPSFSNAASSNNMDPQSGTALSNYAQQTIQYLDPVLTQSMNNGDSLSSLYINFCMRHQKLPDSDPVVLQQTIFLFNHLHGIINTKVNSTNPNATFSSGNTEAFAVFFQHNVSAERLAGWITILYNQGIPLVN